MKRTAFSRKARGYSSFTRDEKPTYGLKRTRMKVRVPGKARTKAGDSAKMIKDECDQLVRRIIALRDHKCITCWAHSFLHVGHLLRRGIESVRWNLRNCNAQCDPCNLLHEEDPHHYAIAFIARYEAEDYAELEALSRSNHKFTYSELLEIRDGLRNTESALIAARKAA